MKCWKKVTPMGWMESDMISEKWLLCDNDTIIDSFDVALKIGKPLDVIKLKGSSLKETKEYADIINKNSEVLYSDHDEISTFDNCPCCSEDTVMAADAAHIFNQTYKRCIHCGHVFIMNQPSNTALNKEFSDDEAYSVFYTDMKSIEVRLSQIIEPKFDWVSKAYVKYYDKKIQSVLDVGAGGGHFIEGCRRKGIHAEGFELSKASGKFAKSVFNIDYIGRDFLEDSELGEKFNIVTFWGLLEYTPHPGDFIEKAKKLLSDDGMLIVEVPRFDCISSVIQKACPKNIARHLDPTSHMNVFSDSSLATLLYNYGLKPVSLWYFGMDAYELFLQMAMHVDNEMFFNELVNFIPQIQSALDYARLCDDIIIAAVPMK